MQFARGRDGGFAQFAIKLFFDRNDYARETAHYVDKAIAPVLPELKFASDNASGSLQQDGYVFPPYMVRSSIAARGILWPLSQQSYHLQAWQRSLLPCFASLHTALQAAADVWLTAVCMCSGDGTWHISVRVRSPICLLA